MDEASSEIRTRLEELRANDPAVLHLGIEIADAATGTVAMTMPVAGFMANIHGICHGGYLFTLADTALAFCCVSVGGTVVSRHAEITFIAPAHVGQTVTATAAQRLAFGRSQICDVVLRTEESVIAYLSGQGTAPPRQS